MADIIYPVATKSAAYHGLASIFEITNDDGKLCNTNCGLAAAATFLTHHQRSPTKAAQDLMALLEQQHPPDIFGGLFGASRHLVRRILRSYGCNLSVVADEKQFKQSLDRRQPVVVMLATPQGKLFNRFDLPGGHWMVAYGYDDEQVHLTNWGSMTWADFNKGWNGLIPALIGMRRRGLAAAC